MGTRRKFIKDSALASVSIALVPLLSGFEKLNKNDIDMYDVIIVGGSYAGLASAMTLGRSQRKVLVIDNGSPCNKQTPHSHNFLTQDGNTPSAISSLAKEQVLKYPTVTFLTGKAIGAKKVDQHFEIEVEGNKKFSSKKIVIATGVKDAMPAIPGFAQCWGISVIHCPYCHGYEVRNEKTGILANGETAFELGRLLSNWTKDSILFTNGACSLSDEQKAKFAQKNIPIIEKEIASLQHTNGHLKNIVFKDGYSYEINVVYSRVPFSQHSDIANSLGCRLADNGLIEIDGQQKTSIPGVYACGDSATTMRTVTYAVTSGNIAGMMLNMEMIQEDF